MVVKKLMMCLIALAGMIGGSLNAQDATGTWQGTSKTDTQSPRLVLQVTKDNGALKGKFFSIHQGGGGITVSAITIQSGAFNFAVSAFDISYEGKLGLDDNPNGLPALFFRGLGKLNVRNATVADFAGLMQSAGLDRPVVDQTALAGRFNFTLNCAHDESQFGGMGIKVPPPTDAADAPQLSVQRLRNRSVSGWSQPKRQSIRWSSTESKNPRRIS